MKPAEHEPVDYVCRFSLCDPEDYKYGLEEAHEDVVSARNAEEAQAEIVGRYGWSLDSEPNCTPCGGYKACPRCKRRCEYDNQTYDTDFGHSLFANQCYSEVCSECYGWEKYCLSKRSTFQKLTCNVVCVSQEVTNPPWRKSSYPDDDIYRIFHRIKTRKEHARLAKVEEVRQAEREGKKLGLSAQDLLNEAKKKEAWDECRLLVDENPDSDLLHSAGYGGFYRRVYSRLHGENPKES